MVTGELGPNVAVIKASDDKQRTAGRHIRMLACCDEILKEKNRSSSHQSSMLDFFKVIFGDSCIATCICWTMEKMTHMTGPQFQGQMSQLLLVCQNLIFLLIFRTYIFHTFVSDIILPVALWAWGQLIL